MRRESEVRKLEDSKKFKTYNFAAEERNDKNSIAYYLSRFEHLLNLVGNLTFFCVVIQCGYSWFVSNIENLSTGQL